MEDRLEVIIYVAFILLSALGSIYKNYSKKKNEQAAKEKRNRVDYRNPPPASPMANPNPRKTVSPKPFPTSIEEFLKQQFEPEEDELIEEPEIRDKIVSNEDKSKTFIEGDAAFETTNEELLSDNMKEKNFSITEMLKKRESVLLENDEISDENGSESLAENQIGEIDLKQAVIYSEIINRKY